MSRTELPLTGPQILQSDFAGPTVVLHIRKINIINYCGIQFVHKLGINVHYIKSGYENQFTVCLIVCHGYLNSEQFFSCSVFRTLMHYCSNEWKVNGSPFLSNALTFCLSLHYNSWYKPSILSCQLILLFYLSVWKMICLRPSLSFRLPNYSNFITLHVQFLCRSGKLNVRF